ncbi:MAG TPA: inorganic phosphate transporter [Thermoanaerobaculia bacterium]|nr:inorganic phosphate transporter [Thermoanaerobaculia bacterium]
MTFVVVVVAAALVFDFVNGFHDAANSIATVVGTRVLTPRIAVIWAAFFNFVAAFAFETRVAQTIGKDIVNPAVVDPVLILAGLLGAIVWNLLTWLWGLPSSSSHALIGGFAGAAVMKAGVKVLVPHGLVRTVAFIVISPLLGLTLGFAFFLAVIWIFRKMRPEPVDRLFRKVQLLSAASFSFGHGLNDAQKTMGIIAVLLYSAGYLPRIMIPFWIILICHAAIALGTLAGGWRIVRTMGMRITALKPVGGSCAEFAGACSLFGASWAGIPVSTTHTITGAIMGVGSVQRFSAVRWGVARRIIVAWILTIPAAALVAAMSWKLLALLNSTGALYLARP